MKKEYTKKLIATGVLLVAIIVIAVIALLLKEKPVEGSKSIVIEVVNSKSETKEYELKTDAQYLRQAMEEAGITFSGTESAYGLMVDTVNGEKADYTVDGAYWGFYVNDEYCNYGIDEQPVEDGDEFQIIYVVVITTE